MDNSNNKSSDLLFDSNSLMASVMFAMIVSFFGLLFVIWNSWCYELAAFKNDTDKNNYYDLLRRELLPVLNTGVARSLSSLNIVLNEFLKRFSENMDDYRDSGQLLNENLSNQQRVLKEINELGLTKTAIKIASVFAKLNESSIHLEKFQDYQKGLNDYIDKSKEVAEEMKLIIEHFKAFNLRLKEIGDHTQASVELQKQFKDSLEKHFPVIEDHREVWRKEIDELNRDVKQVYQELYNYFKKATEQLKNFVDSNGVSDIRTALDIFVENSEIQKIEFEALKQEMIGLRHDSNTSQEASLKNNTALIDALETTIKTEALPAINTLNNSMKDLVDVIKGKEINS